MQLDRLINAVDVFDRPANARRIDITNLTDNTGEVEVGSLFCALTGSRVDGHDLVPEAIAKGAAAVLVERDLGPLSVPQIRVTDVRASLAPLAAEFYGHPDKHLRIVGITGTNGKTTTTHILTAILEAHGWPTASIGTLTGQYTSPPAPKLQAMLADFRDERKHAVVMEVSSHALVQHRVDAVHFRMAIFTNLSQDHLDYHGTMSSYFAAKAMLFDPGRTERAVVNIDDPWGQQLMDRMAVPGVAYSLSDASELQITPSGSTFTWDGVAVALPLVGEFNVMNALAAATAARQLGVPATTIARALGALTPVPGRVERIDEGQDFSVIVDFAHTPDGLEKILAVAGAAKSPTSQVIVVFGCGGDRDNSKRPQMGAIAEAGADGVVLTSDNPRSEDPQVIADQVLQGIQRPERVHVQLDRHKAITFAISHAKTGDVVVIAGKGHEVTQDIGGHKAPFDDRQVASAALIERAGVDS